MIDRIVPGFAEVMRAESVKKTPHAMLSRAVTGIRGSCLIINLPGSPKAVREHLESVLAALPHAVQTIKGEGGECAASGNQGSLVKKQAKVRQESNEHR